MAYSAELAGKCLNYVQTPLTFVSLSSILRVRVSLKNKVFMVVTNSSHNYWQSVAYFNYTNTVSGVNSLEQGNP